MTKRKHHRKTRARVRARRTQGFGDTTKLIGGATKAMVGVTVFTATTNALTQIGKS